MAIQCSFNAFRIGGSDFDVTCAPLILEGGPLGRYRVSRKGLGHFMKKVAGRDLSAGQLASFESGVGITGSITEEDYRTYFSK
jgi:hypothetical protein